MLFNKNDTGTDELKKHLGFLFKSNKFENIETDLMLAEESIIEYIGQPVYALAQTHYDSDDYEKAAPTAIQARRTNLVHHIQLPVALFAYFAYAPHSDISHEDSGRKVQIDPTREKLPWEWMIERDNNAVLNKAHKTTDRLIAFLEKEEANITEWKDSDAQKAARRLFIKNAMAFDKICPIEKSRRFFIKIIPFIDEVERDQIKPVLTPDVFDDIKTAIQEGTTYKDDEDILGMIQVPTALLAMSIAITRLSVEVMPNGIFQNYVSERLTQNAKTIAPATIRKEMSKLLEARGLMKLKTLQEYLEKIALEESGEVYDPVDTTERIDPETKYVRL